MDSNQKIGQVLGELESEIMNIIWEKNQSVSVREVVDALQLQRKIAYTTVMTIMGRLVDKGILNREGNGKAFVYKTVYTKDKFLSKTTHLIINNLVSNFGDIAIAHFAKEVEKITPEKRKRLLELLQEEEK